jgi:hypothetical protein
MKRKAESTSKVGATGSPSGPGPGAPLYPHGIEVLLRRAASDRVFREQLLEQRAGAAVAIGLELDPAEKAMLESIPRIQLLLTIERIEAAGEPRRGFLVKLAVAMLVAVAAGGAWLWSQCEPAYKGKSLSEWLRLGEQFGWGYSNVYAVAGILPRDWRPTPWRIPPKREMAEVEEALRAMGPKAVPPMLARLKIKDPAWKPKLMAWLDKQSLVKFRFTKAESHHKRALIGLTVLGPLATNAVPAIQKAMADPAKTNDWEFQAYAKEALGKITGKP